MKLKTVFVYGQPMILECNGLIFHRDLGKSIIMGEQVERDGMATRVVEEDINDDLILQAFVEFGLWDKLKAGVQGTIAAAKSAPIKAMIQAGQAAAATSHVTSKVTTSTKAFVDAMQGVINFVKFARTLDSNPQATPAMKNAVIQQAGELEKMMQINDKTIVLQAGEWRLSATPSGMAADALKAANHAKAMASAAPAVPAQALPPAT